MVPYISFSVKTTKTHTITNIDINLLDSYLHQMDKELNNITDKYVKGVITAREYIHTQADIYSRYSTLIGNHVIETNPQ